MSDPADRAVVDEGIRKGLERLTPQRIQDVIQHVLDKESAARLQVYMETCVHCGLCAEACHTYLSRDKDPDYAPVAKVQATLWQMVQRKGDVSKASWPTPRASPSPSAGPAGAAACTAPSASTSPTRS
ncbi:MAG: 4Fe-4S dicluster domain-containing protein [Pseudomonadota bacterium]